MKAEDFYKDTDVMAIISGLRTEALVNGTLVEALIPMGTMLGVMIEIKLSFDGTESEQLVEPKLLEE